MGRKEEKKREMRNEGERWCLNTFGNWKGLVQQLVIKVKSGIRSGEPTGLLK